MKLAVALLLFSGLCFAATSEKVYKKSFLRFMREHNKVYEHDEFETRYAAYKDNFDFVQNWNGEFEVGLNVFADLTNAEFNSMYKGLNVIRTPLEDTVPLLPNLPSSVNWTAQGAVTAIKNQGQCGSCWSFSTTGSVEGCTEIATGSLVGLSEQNLIDCSTSYGNDGCNGGLMDQAFQYIIANNGIDTESSYPYTATGPNTCQFSTTNVGATITGYQDIPSGSESALQNAIVNQPISVAIDASQQSFQLYTSGVYYAPGCSSSNLDHGVLAVGFGSASSSTSNPDYYIVKNSWGTQWGIEGYIWMSRNRNNNCGIATSASYPTGCSQ
jgi:cathepsin L